MANITESMVCVSLRHLRAEGHQPQKQQKPEHVSAVFCHGPWISANVSIFEQYTNQIMTLICSGFTASLSFNVCEMHFMLFFISLQFFEFEQFPFKNHWPPATVFAFAGHSLCFRKSAQDRCHCHVLRHMFFNSCSCQ